MIGSKIVSLDQAVDLLLRKLDAKFLVRDLITRMDTASAADIVECMLNDNSIYDYIVVYDTDEDEDE